jgi:hypothetical protein
MTCHHKIHTFISQWKASIQISRQNLDPFASGGISEVWNYLYA